VAAAGRHVQARLALLICRKQRPNMGPGTDVVFFKNIFAEKNCENLAFLTPNKAKLCKILITTLVFEKSANFFAENCRKSQKS
jgi:hypothetical protein